MLGMLSFIATQILFVLGFTIALLTSPSSASSQEQEGTRCRHSGPFIVTRDSIGPLPVQASVGQLRLICPFVRVDTTLRQLADGSYLPVLLFQFDSLEVVGDFASLTKIDVNPNDYVYRWHVRGSGARLSNGLRLDAPWATLVREGGEGGMWLLPSWTFVQFTKWPGLIFAYYGLATVGKGKLLISESHDQIPPTATATELRILGPSKP